MGSPEKKRLDTWKEIAEYLGRDVATVFRWSRDKGLPVHRVPGGKRKSVFAFPHEIDSWLSGADQETLRPRTPDPNPELKVSSQDRTNGAGESPITRRSGWQSRSLQISTTIAILLIVLIAAVIAKSHYARVRAQRANDATQPYVLPQHASKYDFEDGAQGWITRPNTMISQVISSDMHFFEGKRSLAIVFDGPYTRKSQIYLARPPITAGALVSAYVRCPAKSQLSAIALFVEDRDFIWSNDWWPVARLIPGGWNKFTVRVPSDAPTPLSRVGLEFTADAPWKGTCYLDSVQW